MPSPSRAPRATRAIAVEGEEAEFQGINSRVELAAAERVLQQRLRAAAFAAGVSMTDPDTVWLSADTRFAADVTIGPNVRFGPGVSVASNVEIKAFCDIEGARIGRGALIGPFARIRPGSDVAEDVHIGNFVELKATRMGRGAKANHLAYLGDSDIGAASNIGAGTIAVNYDGYGKWRTVVGAEAFVGSNSSLVAPVRIGRGANVTAGSVITERRAGRRRGLRAGPPGHKEGAGRAASCETEGPRGGGQAGQEEEITPSLRTILPCAASSESSARPLSRPCWSRR